MYRSPHKCCICGEKLTVTRLSCEHCGSTLEGRFGGCPFCALSPEETRFLLIFLKNRGNIKDVEREMGLSYPTVRNLLDGLLASLSAEGGLGQADPSKADPSKADPSKADPSKADPSMADSSKTRRDNIARRNILAQLSRHEISADEAARRLRESE